MFDPLVNELSQRYGLGDRGRDLFGLLMGYIHNDRRGGFGGFVENFREQGHGDLLSSWFGDPVGRRSIGAADIGTVFGQGLLNDWGSRLGVSRATLAAAIAGVLPRLVAELTPGGRMPGGFAPVAPYEWPAREADPKVEEGVDHARGPLPAHDTAGTDPATRQDTRAPEGSAGFSARPGVDGLIAPLPERGEPARAAFAPEAPARTVPGAIVPGEQDRRANAEDDTSRGLRREPAPGGASALRTPVSARREPQFDRPSLDPGEQRVADMAAAFNGPATDPAGAAREERGLSDRADRRPAVRADTPSRGGFGWLLWLLLVLAIIAGAGWYAWQQGMLDPYIARYNLALPTSGTPDTR